MSNQEAGFSITLEKVTLRGGGVKLLDSVSTVFPARQCTVVMGFSGSGRSSLLKVAAGILWPDEGVVRVEGKPLERMTEKEMLWFRSQCGFAFQDGALWSNLTVYQNLLLPLQVHRPKVSPDQWDRLIHRLLHEFEFQDSPQFRPAQLSSGERKLVSLLRALVLDPAVLFLDEPTSFLDNQTVERVLQTLKKKQATGQDHHHRHPQSRAHLPTGRPADYTKSGTGRGGRDLEGGGTEQKPRGHRSYFRSTQRNRRV